VYFENGEPVNWDAVYQTKTVIIDMHGELDSNAIDHLFDYTGKILIISNDPLMDFNEGNILASKVHALAGFETFYPAVTDKTWAAKKWPAAQVNILERLKLLQRTR